MAKMKMSLKRASREGLVDRVKRGASIPYIASMEDAMRCAQLLDLKLKMVVSGISVSDGKTIFLELPIEYWEGEAHMSWKVQGLVRNAINQITGRETRY